MKYGERKLGHASLMVTACLGLPEKMRKDTREITKVYCAPEARNTGEATALMKQVCAEADKKRMILVLTVRPYGEHPPAVDKAKLLDWYATTFDFNAIQQEPLILARMFNPFPDSGLTEKIGSIITEGI